MINRMPVKQLYLCAGARTRLRWWTTQDDQRQRAWPQYPDPCSHLWNIPPSSSSSAGGLFGGTSTWMRRVWAIDDLHGTLIGRISLRDIEQRSGRARLGISLAAPYVGQGLGTEALRLFLDYYFYELLFKTMVLDVAAFNQRAVRCYERLGFAIISSDWRRTSAGRCSSVINDPAQAPLQQHFRRERQSVWVEFYEMELAHGDWETNHRAGTVAAPALV